MSSSTGALCSAGRAHDEDRRGSVVLVHADIETILRNRSLDDLAGQKVDQPESEILRTIK